MSSQKEIVEKVICYVKQFCFTYDFLSGAKKDMNLNVRKGYFGCEPS